MIRWRQDARRIAEYVAGLDDGERDRVLVAQGWGFGREPLIGLGPLTPDSEGFVFGCLMEHIVGGSLGTPGVSAEVYRRHERQFSPVPGTVSYAFDALCERLTLDRVVRFCKRRATRPNRLPHSPSLPVHEAVGVGGD